MTHFTSAALAALLLAIPIPVARSQAPVPTGDASSPFQISVNLNLVVLPVTVRDRKGGFAADLTEQNFEVYEEGVRQSIRLFRHEDIPVTVGLVIDHSGSMRNKMGDVLAAAQTFVRSSNTEDQMFVVNFNEHPTLGLPAALPFTNHADDMTAAILKAPASGETALYDALDMAIERLRLGDREKKVLIVISDGGDNASVLTLPRILDKAAKSNAVLYAIGIYDANDPDQKPRVLRQLAHDTGGEPFFPTQFSQAIAICEGIAKDIRHQYTIGYVSTNPHPGGQRAVRVVARSAGKDLVVRTRSGYFAGEGTR